MRSNTIKLSEELLVGLEEKLGKSYIVSSQFASGSIGDISFELRPDLTIKNNETGKITVVEIKGSNPEDDLPLATISDLKRIKSANRAVNPDFLLVSVSNVPDQLKQDLHEEGIRVIQWVEKEDVVDEIILTIDNS